MDYKKLVNRLVNDKRITLLQSLKILRLVHGTGSPNSNLEAINLIEALIQDGSITEEAAMELVEAAAENEEKTESDPFRIVPPVTQPYQPNWPEQICVMYGVSIPGVLPYYDNQDDTVYTTSISSSNFTCSKK